MINTTQKLKSPLQQNSLFAVVTTQTPEERDGKPFTSIASNLVQMILGQ